MAKGGRDKSGDRFERLIGDVIFVQNETTIYCDSAHFYKKKNALEAYGKVRITDGDSVNITGRKLQYDGDGKTAKIRNNVVFTKKGAATLYTDNLDYLRGSNVAYYFDGGKLVDSANVLTSQKGYYNVKNNLASFRKDVKVVNPDYTMRADSLQYNSKTKVIYFVAKTTVLNKDGSTLEYEKGVYNTESRVSVIREGTLESEDYTIVGKKYNLDAVSNIAQIRGDVIMKHKVENLIIYGQASDHFKSKGITKVYDNAYIAKVSEDNDTLFMRADTLVSFDSEDPAKKRIIAYHNVKIFKSDMQGIADSMEYRSLDSTLYFYNKPVLWSQGNQFSADTISLLIKNNKLDKMFLVDNAFVISTDTMLNYNQMKGRRMTASIINSKVNKVLVEGNGESIYFALDEKDNSLMGMNRILCSNIIIRFAGGRVNNVSFLNQPEANFIPPHEFKDDEMTLKGFAWKPEAKPSRNEVIARGAPEPDKKTQQGKKQTSKKPTSESKKAVQKPAVKAIQ